MSIESFCRTAIVLALSAGVLLGAPLFADDVAAKSNAELMKLAGRWERSEELSRRLG